jgi:hypothetical protein
MNVWDFFAGFVVGLLFGGAAGIIIISIAVAARRADDAFNVPPPSDTETLASVDERRRPRGN